MNQKFCQPVFQIVSPHDIFNLTDPMYLPEISLNWSGNLPWHDKHYDFLRLIIKQKYITLFNKHNGHYKLLEENVLKYGFLNPIVISAGGLQIRKPEEIPPDLKIAELLISEYFGGSRLMVAKDHDMPIPCIINDYNNLMPRYDCLKTESDIRSRFTNQPDVIEFKPDGSVYINNISGEQYIHLEEKYSVREQSLLRRDIISEIKLMTKAWLENHDKEANT